MATIIARTDGRYEIRESVTTPRGPRSRTLAIFRELTPEVLDHAATRARDPLDRDEIVARAAELGLHVKRIAGDVDTAEFVRRVRSGTSWPTHVRAVQTATGSVRTEPLPGHLEPMVDWMGVDDETRSRTLVDLLGLADAIMQHRENARARERLRFPPLSACRA